MAANQPSFVLYHSCIRLCNETEKCVAITFREQTNDCWLKSSVDNEPKSKRSFVSLDCLQLPENALYPGYQEKVSNHKTLAWICPKGFIDIYPIGENCFVFTTKRPSGEGFEAATNFCRTQYKAKLGSIRTKDLKDAYVRELLRAKIKHVAVQLNQKMGLYFLYYLLIY